MKLRPPLSSRFPRNIKREKCVQAPVRATVQVSELGAHHKGFRWPEGEVEI